jgi:uncharacterized membrane protein
VQDVLISVTVPLAICLMLFSMDLKAWLPLARPTFLSFGLMLFAVVAASSAAFALFQEGLEETWKISGMLVGVYTGGTPNLNAIGLALKVREHTMVLVNTADMLLGMPWLLFVLLLAQRVFLLFLQPFESCGQPRVHGATAPACVESMDISQYAGMFRREVLTRLPAALGLASVIFGVSAVLYAFAPTDYNMAVLMLSVTTLAIGSSFFSWIRNIPMTFQLGQYLILIFCLVIGAMADIEQLFRAAPDILFYVFAVMYGAFALHMILARIFRIDADTAIITATAAIMSPPFVPVVASALKNREVIISGLATGIFGYAVGNYLGIGFAHVLRAISGI